MREHLIECPLCGHRYDPLEKSGCQSCPLNKSCGMVCCPACGYQMVDIATSSLASLAESWLFRRRARRRGRNGHRGWLSLADVPVGCQVRVLGFGEGFPPDRRAHLQAYGLVPDYTARVVQQTPVTILKIDHTELALENELAAQIRVRILDRCPVNDGASA